MSILILGGGASGLAAAICAAQRGAQVCIDERAARVGRKILASGTGRCTVSNQAVVPEAYHGDPAFLRAVFDALPPREARAFLEELGLVFATDDGRHYPYIFTAASALDALRMALEREHIRVEYDRCAVRIQPSRKGGFSVSFADGSAARADTLVCAMGGKAAPHLGTDGSGLALLRELGHSVTPLYPALVQLRCRHAALKGLKGVRVRAQLTLSMSRSGEVQEMGEVLFTDYGVSGVAVFQLSRHAAHALGRGEEVTLFLNLWPELTVEMLRRRAALFGAQPAEALFTGVFHRLVAQAVVRQACVEAISCAALSSAQLQALLRAAQGFVLPVTGTQSFEQAQVTSGGVSTAEIDPRTFESRLYPGLYIVGESVDVDGPCGGFNLHFAFTSGILAGRAASERSKA